MPSPEGWLAMFAYRADDGEVVLHTSPLKFWTLAEGPSRRGRLFANGVTEDGSVASTDNPHFCGYLREGEAVERYRKVGEAHLRRLEEAGAPLLPTLEDHE